MHKRPLHHDHFWFIMIPHLISLRFWFVHQKELYQFPVVTSSSEVGETRREKAAEFCPQTISLILVRSLTFRKKITTWDRQLYFLSEGSKATDFNRLKNKSIALGRIWARKSWIKWQARYQQTTEDNHCLLGRNLLHDKQLWRKLIYFCKNEFLLPIHVRIIILFSRVEQGIPSKSID